MRQSHARPVRRRRLVRVVLAGSLTLVLGVYLAPWRLLATSPGFGSPAVLPATADAAVAPSPPGPEPASSVEAVDLPAAAARLPASAGHRFGETLAPVVSTLRGYRWPLPHGRTTLPFGPTAWGSRVVGGESFHDGIDIATFCGDRIAAAHDGTVLAAGRRYDAYMGWVGDLGPYVRRLDQKQLWSTLPIVVVIDDGNGYRSVYAHFSRVVVKRGQVVHAGQLIGFEGMSGRASGCHLHYGLFSPRETATFGMTSDVVSRMKLPDAEIARVDPLLVLPARSKTTPEHGSSGSSDANGHELPLVAPATESRR